MKRFNNITTNKKASVAVEFAILLPLLLLIFFGTFELARYIIISRKIDNTATDIAFIFAREGDLYNVHDEKLGTFVPRPVGENGAAFIKAQIADLVPMLMYPYNSKKYALDIRYVGLPLGAINNSTNLRIMWAQGICGDGSKMSVDGKCGAEIGVTVQTFRQETGSCSTASSTIGGDVYCVNNTERARILLPGQAFVLVNFAYPYNPIINQGSEGNGTGFSKNLERVASFPARSLWIDSGPAFDSQIQPSEYYNNMFRCTDCTPYNSTSDSSTEGMQDTKFGSSCDDASAADKSVKGCKFN